jgi:hypothetical protein
MELYINHMIEEKNQLEDKIRKTGFFLKNSTDKLDEKQKDMLSKQIEAMKNYVSILTERIEYDSHKSRTRI